jgi:UDP-N-acetylglucosamine acyltransferase
MSEPDAIHPTAVVDPKANLAAGVRIGAFSVIGAEVTIAADAEIGHHCVLEGKVEIGERARIGHGTVLGGLPQDLKFKDGTPSGVRVGADTAIREYVTVHRATHAGSFTEIGAGCLIMAMSHVAHDCRLDDGAIVINYAGLTGHCHIGYRATVGGMVGMVPFTRVGDYAYIGGCSKVTADVPPYMLVDGNPAGAHAVNVVGLRRAGMKPADRRLLQDAFRLLYRSGLATPRAVERIRAELSVEGPVAHLLEFIAGSRRGICGAAQPGAAAPDGAAPAESETV